jgi:hypothetical protein
MGSMRNPFARTSDSASLAIAKMELAHAEQAERDQYEWMVEKYVGRERFIPEHVPEMREYGRLQEITWDEESRVLSLRGEIRDGDLETWQYLPLEPTERKTCNVDPLTREHLEAPPNELERDRDDELER